MTREIWVYGPTLAPIIEQHGSRYLVDLKRGHFRGLTSPYEALPFSPSCAVRHPNHRFWALRADFHVKLGTTFVAWIQWG